MPPSCALLGGFAIGARVVLLWQHNANPSYKLASIPRYDNIVRTLGGVCSRAAGRWPAGEGAFLKLHAVYGKWAWLTGRWLAVNGGILKITAVWTAGFQWWHSGDTMQTQNVSKYMLVLALCLVFKKCFICFHKFSSVFACTCGDPFSCLHIVSQIHWVIWMWLLRILLACCLQKKNENCITGVSILVAKLCQRQK